MSDKDKPIEVIPPSKIWPPVIVVDDTEPGRQPTKEVHEKKKDDLDRRSRSKERSESLKRSDSRLTVSSSSRRSPSPRRRERSPVRKMDQKEKFRETRRDHPYRRPAEYQSTNM